MKGLDLESVLGNTIHGDGTTKYHRHYQSFQVTTQEGQSLSVGLLETAGQDAETIFNCWKDRVAEIANATCGSVSSSETLKKTTDQLLVSIKNSMSDQCATNGVFNSLLSELRKDVLPNVIANWETFTEPQKESFIDMGNFFCKVHPLITFAEDCNKILLKFETACLENYKSKHVLLYPSESGAVRLIRTACSAFQKRGHQAAGQSEDFLAYLDELGEKLYLIQMEGNQFNVIFHNGAAVYYHLSHLKNYIQNKSQKNRLISAVLEDSQNPVYVAGVRALGIISKLITGLYFRIVGEVQSVLDLNPHLLQLQLSLQKLSKDASPLLEAEPIFSEDIVMINKDSMFEELFKPLEPKLQILTQQALELMCGSVLLVLERQCQDQLPGG